MNAFLGLLMDDICMGVSFIYSLGIHVLLIRIIDNVIFGIRLLTAYIILII